MNTKPAYVVTVVADSPSKIAVGLVKKKGLPNLLNKISFPGGTVEVNESVQQASSREFLEETSIWIEPEAWTLMACIEYPDRTVHFMGTVSSKVFNAKTMENEPVFLMEMPFHLKQSQIQPSVYAPDFVSICKLASECLALGL